MPGNTVMCPESEIAGVVITVCTHALCQNYCNLCIKTVPVAAGLITLIKSGFCLHTVYCVYCMFIFGPETLHTVLYTVASRERIRFYEEIQIIFGTVCAMCMHE